MLQKNKLNTTKTRIELINDKKKKEKKLEIFTNTVDLCEKKGEKSTKVLQNIVSLKSKSLFYNCPLQCISSAGAR